MLEHGDYEQKVVVAKKEHDCYECEKVIEVGQRYLSYTASPRHDMNSTGKWLHAAFCFQCSKYSPEWGPIGGRVVARYTCERCGADCNTMDQPHLCKDVRKRYERNKKSVDLVAVILEKRFGEANGWWDESFYQEVATEIIKALSGRDLGVD